MCSIQGPYASTRSGLFNNLGVLECEVRYSPMAFALSSPPLDSVGAGASLAAEEKYIAQLIIDALEASVLLDKYAKMVISISVMILESSHGSSGGDIGAAVTCASLALADAAIELRSLVSACSVAFVEGRGVVPDPLLADVEAAQGVLTLANMCTDQSVTQLWLKGKLSENNLIETIKCACAENIVLGECISKSLREHQYNTHQ